MENLVLRYFESEEFVGHWEHIKPFKYSSKEDFFLAIMYQPIILKEFNLWDETDLTTSETIEEILDEIEVFTLEEWFSKNEIILK